MNKIALGAWAWGNDGTFGNNLHSCDLKPVFETAFKNGLLCGIVLMFMVWEQAKMY